MKKNDRRKNKGYRSITEIEKKFFPNSYKEGIEKKKSKNLEDIYLDLAIEFLENMKRKTT